MSGIVCDWCMHNWDRMSLWWVLVQLGTPCTQTHSESESTSTTIAGSREARRSREKGDDICCTNIPTFRWYHFTFSGCSLLGCLIPNAPIFMCIYVFVYKNYTVFTGGKIKCTKIQFQCGAIFLLFLSQRWMIQSKHKRSSLHMNRISCTFFRISD